MAKYLSACCDTFPSIPRGCCSLFKTVISATPHALQPEHMVGEARRSVDYLTKALEAARNPLAKLAADVKEQEEKARDPGALFFASILCALSSFLLVPCPACA